MIGLAQDIRLTLRGLIASPGFTAVAVMTLALGIGSATAIYSMADAVVLRPLPYREADRLVVIWQSNRARNQPFLELSYPAFREWRDRTQLFESLAAMPAVNQEVVLTGRGDAAPLQGRWVTANLFDVLGAEASIGRTLVSDDDHAGAAPVVLLSDGLWKRRFGGDPAIVGQSITLNERAYSIVGVMPPGFAYPEGAELWVPLGPAAGPRLLENDGVYWMIAVGRLRSHATLEAGRSELTEIWQQRLRPYVDTDGFVSVLTPLTDIVFGSTRPALFALLGAVGLVLLISCANIAGLLIVRNTNRHFDMAVRHSLGASRIRLARGTLIESLLLGLAGGIGGLAIAAAAIPLMAVLSPSDVPRIGDVALNLRVFGFAAIVAMLAAVLSAVAPMASIGRSSLAELPRQTSHRTIARVTRAAPALVVAEVAVAVIVVVAATLVARSFVNLRQVPLGYETDRVLTARISPKGTRYSDRRRVSAFYQLLLERVRGLPGVESAAAITHRPLWSTVGYDGIFTAEGQSDQEALRNPMLNAMAISADYFRTMGIPLKRGRTFTDADAEGQPGVVVISESLARRVWPGQDVVGKRLKLPMPDTPYHNAWLTVVGVVGDARYREIQASRLDFYMSHLQADTRPNYLMVRSSLHPSALAGALRDTVRSLDASVPVSEVTSMEQIVSQALGSPRFAATVFTVFAAIALALATLGIYGLLSYLVTLRTREIGVRMALGASMGDVLRSILTGITRLTVLGTGIGLLLAAMLGRLIEGILFGVRPSDPVTLVMVVAMLGISAILACLAPALRAARVDPLTALRYE